MLEIFNLCLVICKLKLNCYRIDMNGIYLLRASCILCKRPPVLSPGSKTSVSILSLRHNSLKSSVSEAVKNCSNGDSLLTDTTLKSSLQNSAEVFGIGAFKYWLPSGILQDKLIQLTETFGWSWPSVLVLCSVATRAILFPVTIQLNKLVVRRNNLAPKRIEIQKETMAEVDRSMNMGVPVNTIMQIINNMRLKQFQLESAHKCGPLEMTKYPMLQLPVILTMFLGIRDLAERGFLGLSSSSFLWITSLSSSDPFFILPALNISTVYLTLKLGVESGPMPFLGSRKADMFFLAFLPFGTYLMNTYFPPALVLYWFASNCFGMVVVKLLKMERLRLILKIPKKVDYGKDFNDFELTLSMNKEMQKKVRQYIIQQERMKYDSKK